MNKREAKIEALRDILFQIDFETMRYDLFTSYKADDAKMIIEQCAMIIAKLRRELNQEIQKEREP